MIDDEDDSMAANIEEPRGASYEATTVSRRRAKPDGLTHFAIVERPGALPIAAARPVTRACRECGAGGVMHADPRNSIPDRVMCGECQGRINRDRMGGPQ